MKVIEVIDGKTNKINNMGNTEYKLKQEQLELFPIDATLCTSLQQMGIIFNALGVGMTEEFAKRHGLEHLLVPKDEDKI